MDIVTLALARKYVKETLSGLGALEGKDGKSAYELAVANGYSGSETEWLKSLVGEAGKTPFIGENGNWWIGETDTGVLAAGEHTEGIEILKIVELFE